MKRFIIFAYESREKVLPNISEHYAGSYDSAIQVLDNLNNLDSGPYAAILRSAVKLEVWDQLTYYIRSVFVYWENNVIDPATVKFLEQFCPAEGDVVQRRYMLFGLPMYEEQGGMGDFLMSFETPAECVAWLEQQSNKRHDDFETTLPRCTGINLFDRETSRQMTTSWAKPFSQGPVSKEYQTFLEFEKLSKHL